MGVRTTGRAAIIAAGLSVEGSSDPETTVKLTDEQNHRRVAIVISILSSNYFYSIDIQ